MRIADDEFWRRYERASESHERAMRRRLDAQRELADRPSDGALERWNAASRDEDKCYEELKAAERVVWAKFKTT
jgi:nucleosome binding factor SPN SPT16 subunit